MPGAHEGGSMTALLIIFQADRSCTREKRAEERERERERERHCGNIGVLVSTDNCFSVDWEIGEILVC